MRMDTFLSSAVTNWKTTLIGLGPFAGHAINYVTSGNFDLTRFADYRTWMADAAVAAIGAAMRDWDKRPPATPTV